MKQELTLTTYKLNLNDPRVRQRIEGVLAWCDQLIGSSRGKPVPADEIIKVFGNTSQNPLAKQLKAKLLNVTEKYIQGVRFNRYTINQRGYRELYGFLGQEVPDEVEILRRRYADVLNGVPLDYRDNGLRRYHHFQNIKRELRWRLCEGWWDYDIEACAPTLLYQYALMHHRVQGADQSEPFPALARLINEKEAVRKHVAELTGLDPLKSKGLLLLLLFRAGISPSYKQAIFSLLGEDRARLGRLLADPFVTALRSDVERMWDAVICRYTDEMTASGKSTAVRPKLAKLQMRIYLTLERRVMDVVTGQLADQGVVPILIHDGFMSRCKVDTELLEKAVFDQTGFEIRFSQDQLRPSACPQSEPDVVDLMRGVSVDVE